MSEWTMVARSTRDCLGEGLLWSSRENALYWVDILAPALNRLSLSDSTLSRWMMPATLGWIAEREGGGFMAGLGRGFAQLELEPVRVRPIGEPEPGYPGNRMNDGKTDARGRIWCGTMDMAEKQDSGALYRLDPDLSWTRMDYGYRVPNGPAFSPCGQWLYLADSARRVVYRYELDQTGQLEGRIPLIRFDESEGYPDGMTTDVAGCLWVAHWGGGRISRFAPDGRHLRTIALPARQVSNVCFAGQELDRMFVTSAATGLTESLYDGALFEVRCEAVGLPPNLFGG